MRDIRTIIELSPVALILTHRAALGLAPGCDQQSAEDTSSWRGTINGWVKDQKIRRDALIAVSMLLATVIAIVWIIFHFGGSSLAPVLSTTIGKIIAGSTAVTIAGVGGGALLRRRRHPVLPPPQLSTAPTTMTDPQGTPPRAARKKKGQSSRPQRDHAPSNGTTRGIGTNKKCGGGVDAS